MLIRELLKEDLYRVVSRLPKDVKDLIIEDSLYLAGGFVRDVISGEKATDIDLFGLTKEQLSVAATKLSERSKGRVHRTHNAITVLSPSRLPVQFITRWSYKDDEEVIKSFDFTVCQAVIYASRDSVTGQPIWRGYCSGRFYPDLASKRLTYTCPEREEEAGGSLLRVVKFLRHGYGISPADLSNVVARVLEKVDSERVGRAPLGQIITGILREVDPLRVIDGIEMAEEE